MRIARKRRCHHCSTYFVPNFRNAGRQRYCSAPDCRRASKASSQCRWLEKNPDYFKGSVHVNQSGSGVKPIPARTAARHQQRCYKIPALRNSPITKAFLSKHLLSSCLQGLCYKISSSCNIPYLLDYWHILLAACYKMTLRQPPDIWIF